MLLGVLLLAAAIAIFIYVMNLSNEVERYNFENRTDGGTVKYDSFEKSKEFQRKTALARLTGVVAFFMAVPGLIIIGISLSS